MFTMQQSIVYVVALEGIGNNDSFWNKRMNTIPQCILECDHQTFWTTKQINQYEE